METNALGLQPVQTNRDFVRFYEANRDQLYRGVALVVKDPFRARDAVDEAMARLGAVGLGEGIPTSRGVGISGCGELGGVVFPEASMGGDRLEWSGAGAY